MNEGSYKLPVEVVERLQRLIGSNPQSHEMVSRFIAHQYGANTLADLPVKVGQAICKRPADFARAVRRHCEQTLF